jgi:lysophospholipase L1-like esterase
LLHRSKYILLLVLFIPFLLLSHDEAVSEKRWNYIAVGDSLTAGLGASEKNYLRLGAFVPTFVRHLREQRAVYVENHGIPGLTSSALLVNMRYSRGLQEKIKTSDIITISIGGNDLLQFLRTKDVTVDEAYAELKEIENRVNEINSFLRSLNNEAQFIYIGLYNPYPPDHQLHQLGKLVIPKFNEMLNSLTAEKTKVVNPYPPFVGNEKKYTHIEKNDIHPNDSGYKQISELLIKVYTNKK